MQGKERASAVVSTTKAINGPECRLLALGDLCKQMHVSIAQLQKLRRAGKILHPTVTLGRSPRWFDLEFYDWLRAGCPAAVYWTWKGKNT